MADEYTETVQRVTVPADPLCVCGHPASQHAPVEESRVGACYFVLQKEHRFCTCNEYREVND